MLEPSRRRRRRAVGRVVGLALLGALAAACAAPPGSADGPVRADGTPDDRPVVLTTFTVLADIARNVAGDRVRVESITKVGAEIHGYEPTPGDLRRAAAADLILDNGLGLEAWFERFVADLDVPHVVVSEGVVPIPIADDGAPPPAPDGVALNPHAWMSPTAGARYTSNIADALAELDPAGAATYRANAEAYAAELETLAEHLVTSVATVPADRRVLVTCEGAFSYLARDAGLAEAYIWPVNAERQATPRRVARVIDLVREREVPAVFCESTVSSQPMERVAESSDAALAGTLYVDSLSEPDGAVPTYLDLLRHDIDVIVAGLTRSATSQGGHP